MRLAANPDAPTPKRAIAFMLAALSANPAGDERAIQRYAHRNGYNVVKVMRFDPGAVDPTLRLVTAMHSHDAAAVLVPSLAHVNRTRRTITERWELVAVTSERVWPRGHRWPWPSVG